MHICLCFSPAARQVVEIALELPAGSKVEDVLALLKQTHLTPNQAHQTLSHPQLAYWAKTDADSVQFGIWSKKCKLDKALEEGDRLELYRPLRVDPKVARRERFQSQGAKTAGLFASRRAGAKPGY